MSLATSQETRALPAAQLTRSCLKDWWLPTPLFAVAEKEAAEEGPHRDAGRARISTPRRRRAASSSKKASSLSGIAPKKGERRRDRATAAAHGDARDRTWFVSEWAGLAAD